MNTPILPPSEKPLRVLYDKSRPCFHCSKSLQQLVAHSKGQEKVCRVCPDHRRARARISFVVY